MATLSLVKIKPGTTPTLTAVVDGEAIQNATVYITIDMKDRQLVKTNHLHEGDIVLEPVYSGSTQIGTKLTVQYSQAETLRLRPGVAQIEVGWVFEDGAADKTNIGRIRISKTLFRGVMTYGRHTS